MALYESFEMIDDNKIENIKDINFFEYEDEKLETYQLLNEEDEILLCKEEIIEKMKENKDDNYKFKIKELYQGVENKNYYYINKENLKEKYLKYFYELNKKDENDININNEDKEEMDKLYKETIMKHPRKIINGEIKKYPFFTWSGFFCFKNDEFHSLGFGISSYFKTLKLFILFFFLISIVNLIASFYYSRYKSIFKFENILDFLIKTTLGNTVTTYYNSVIYNHTNKNFTLLLNCSNMLIGKFVSGVAFKNLNSTEIQILNKINIIKNTFIEFPKELEDFTKKSRNSEGLEESKAFNFRETKIEFYNEKLKECLLKNECQLEIKGSHFFDYDFFNFIYHEYIEDIYALLFYECIDNSLSRENDSPNSLRNMSQGIAITTSILLIILYFYYKKAISYDNKEYNKDKIFINNYTLVLSNLKINSNKDYYQEINDLIYYLNDIISNEMDIYIDNNNLLIEKLNDSNNIEKNNYNNKYLYIFDINVSNINGRKMKIFEKIKSLKNNISDIKEDNDTLKKLIKHKIKGFFKSFNILYKNITEKNVENKNENLFKLNALLSEKDMSLEKEEKIENKKNKIKTNLMNITDEIPQLHEESKRRNYVDIYLTFRNPSISYYIYNIYKKNKCERLLLYLFCKGKIIKKYYYKNQWLDFEISKNSPNDIQWENCYISKFKKIIIRIIVCIATIYILYYSFLYFNDAYFINNKYKFYNYNFLITYFFMKIVSVITKLAFKKLTKLEKNSTLSKNILSNILKYYVFNFCVSGFLINKFFDKYNNSKEYLYIIKSIMFNMLFSSFTPHLPTIFFYLLNLLRRYIDSKYTNGRETRLKNKLKYENLYVGPEFEIDNRYSIIFVNLSICMIYGSFCPLIYLFFTLFLITTFIIDKYLIINYYKKPKYYGNYLSKKVSTFFFFSILFYIFGINYYFSNPYLFNFYQNNSYRLYFRIYNIYIWLINPFSLIYYKDAFNGNLIPNLIFNLSNLVAVHHIIFIIFFYMPLAILKVIKLFKKRTQLISLKKTQNIDIGNIYSYDELVKYYEIKKIELFKFLINCKRNGKILKNYIHYLNNYKTVIDYLKKIINYKNLFNNKNNKNENEKEIFIQENNIKNIKVNENKIIGNVSYNLSFNPNYELYYYFDLLNNI